jgi:hypothetical protein
VLRDLQVIQEVHRELRVLLVALLGLKVHQELREVHRELRVELVLKGLKGLKGRQVPQQVLKVLKGVKELKELQVQLQGHKDYGDHKVLKEYKVRQVFLADRDFKGRLVLVRMVIKEHKEDKVSKVLKVLEVLRGLKVQLVLKDHKELKVYHQTLD